MNAARLLEVLRDARDEGLWQEQAAVLSQLDIDVEYRRFVTRNQPFKPYMHTAADYEPDEYGDDPGPVPTDEEIAAANRQRRMQAALTWKCTDWTRWKRRPAVASLSDIYKRIYTDQRVSNVASRGLPPFQRAKE